MGYPIPLSNSRLEKAACLYKFFRFYVADPAVVEPKTTPMLLGGVFHFIVDAYHREIAKGEARQARPVSDPELMARVFDQCWAKRPEEYAGLGEEHRQPILDLCMDWVPRYPVGPAFAGSEVRLALNQEWQRCDWMAEDVRYRMIIDRVDIDGLTVWVRDWKTGWVAPSEKAAQNDPQMQGYALGIAAVMPEAQIINVALVYPRLHIERTAVVDKVNVDRAKERIERESARIERARATNKWQAIPGEQCAFCPVWKECPEMKAASDFRAPGTEDEAKALLGKLALLNRQAGAVKGHLRAWVNMCGPVVSEGLVAENRPQKRIDYLDEFLLTLERAGVDPVVLMKWDRKALQRAAKQIPDVREAIELYTREVVKGTKWYVGKEGQEPYEPDED